MEATNMYKELQDYTREDMLQRIPEEIRLAESDDFHI